MALERQTCAGCLPHGLPPIGPNMQPHEGPRPDPERERQRLLTIRLVGVIGALLVALVVALAQRFV
jgi:hypothetical protein